MVDVAVRAFTEPVTEIVLGPTIGACCYEFGDDDLMSVARGVHADVAAIRSVTSAGAPALDVRAAVGAAAAHHGLRPTIVGGCTGCDVRRVLASGPARSRASGRGGMETPGPDVNDVSQVRDGLASVRDRIGRAGGGADVAVLAVTKAFGPEVIDLAAAAGCRASG